MHAYISVLFIKTITYSNVDIFYFRFQYYIYRRSNNSKTPQDIITNSLTCSLYIREQERKKSFLFWFFYFCHRYWILVFLRCMSKRNSMTPSCIRILFGFMSQYNNSASSSLYWKYPEKWNNKVFICERLLFSLQLLAKKSFKPAWMKIFDTYLPILLGFFPLLHPFKLIE